MSRSGPIIIVEDDRDDQEIFEEIFKELKVSNSRVYFSDVEVAFQFLKTNPVQPVIIISDVNLPRYNGIEFKRRIDDDPVLRKKSIPFIFMSTSIAREAVTEAFTKMTVQGYFQKRTNFHELKDLVSMILSYWKESKHPNS